MSRDDERTGTYRGSADALPVEQALLLEQVCDAFEAAWRTGGDRPDIAAAVEELPEAVRPAAMRELAALDVHYRIRAGERPVAADYPGLHPAWLAGLSVAFEPGSTKSPSPASKDNVSAELLAGKYKLIEVIGEGGMGSVWMAQQTEPVKRAVAVKLIKAGMDSKAVLARFEAERQALAMMDHPNIAKVLDAGTTEQGRPFFVMELVKGIPITKFCDDRKLTPDARLELFVQVCQAIQHAHQKGVIHRDIKPGNVLVALYDDKPVPKVIDFGVAKATWGLLTDRTLMTGFGAVVGTPEYMSPEQAGFNQMDVDTRSDIYALGVLLYELLTGTTPVDRKTLGKAALLEILRIVREVEAPRPSAKLSTSDALPTISANRGVEPRKLTGLMRNELDWIVMKALEKDRTRRYDTANGFAADINRYLGGEAVLAHPPSAGYRMRKFLRKNRGPAVAASVVALALLGGIAGTTLGLVRATQSADAERLAKFDAEGQKTNAEQSAEAERAAKGRAVVEAANARQSAAAEKAAKEQAQYRLTQIEKGNAVLTSIFDDLNTNQVREGTEPLGAVLAKRLVKAGEQLEGETVGAPLMVADLQNKLGETLLSLGYPQEAIPMFQKALTMRTTKLGADDPATLTCRSNLALSYRATGKLGLAVSLHEETLQLRKAKLGADHSDTLGSMNNLAASYWAAGKPDMALPLFEETLRLRKAKSGTEHPETLRSMNNLAVGYRAVGKPDLALPLYEETLKLMKAKLGGDHPLTLTCMSNLAVGYQEAGKLDLALPLHEETLKLVKAKLGVDHPETLSSMSNLAEGYRAVGKPDLAMPLHMETFKLMKAKLGADHPDTLTSMNFVAVGYQEAGKLDLALPLHEETLKLRKAKLGADHPDTLTSMNFVAVGYWLTKRLDKSIPLFEEELNLQEKKLGRSHFETIATVGNLGVNYRDAGRLVEALPLLEETYRASKANTSLRWIGPQLLDGYAKSGKAKEAVALVGELLSMARARLPKDGPDLAGTLDQCGLALLELKAYPDAEPILRECLAIREKAHPDAWHTFNTQSMLGGALLGQKKHVEAEALLLKGYGGLKAREKTIPLQSSARLPEAADRLVELYTATDKPDEVKKWRAERAKYGAEVAPPPRRAK